MALYRYTGLDRRVFPAVPVTVDPGDVVDLTDADPNWWEPVKTAKTVRSPDNATPAAAEPVVAPAVPDIAQEG